MASGKSVNVPTNEKIKEQDVNNKLQLYGIYRGELLIHMRTNQLEADLKLSSFCKWQGTISEMTWRDILQQ